MQFNPAKSWTALYSDQVPPRPSLPSTKSLLSPHIFGFSFPVLNPGWKVFLLTISTPYDLSIFLPSPLHELGGFLLIDPLSGFLSQFPTRLGGFSPATWLFKTHQLPYKAKMFSMVSRFSSPVSPIGLGGFSLGSHFFLTILHSTELVSKERSNYNNVTLRTESSQTKSHIIIIIQNFTLVSLTSTMTPHPVKLPLGAAVSSLPTHLTPYTPVFLHTRIFIIISVYQLEHSAELYIWNRLLVKTCNLSSSILAVCGEEVELLVRRNWRSSSVW